MTAESTVLACDERTARIQLACLPSMYPQRLSEVLAHHRGVEAVGLLDDGGDLHPAVTTRCRPGTVERWRRDIDTARSTARKVHDLADRARSRRGGAETVPPSAWDREVGAVVKGARGYPDVLAHDPSAPEVLFVRGDLGKLEARRVGIVGTRNATAAGRATAAHLGVELADAGVSIVSGLARGVDASAHLGVREAGKGGAIAVVGSGIDVVYPRCNRALWEWVGRDGLLLSQWPPGDAPEAWHFPLRNHLIAALSEVVVVVESRARGGSLITAEAALLRGIDVLAVPGSRYCEAAQGTNQLIADGAGLVSDVDDVLVALNLSSAGRVDAKQARRFQPGDDPVLPDLAVAVYACCLERPMTVDQLAESTRAPLLEVARVLTRLEQGAWVQDVNGWWEAVASRLGLMLNNYAEPQ